MEVALEQADIPYVRLDGAMSLLKRADAIRRLQGLQGLQGQPRGCAPRVVPAAAAEPSRQAQLCRSYARVLI